MKVAKINLNLFKQNVIKNITQKTIKPKTVTTLPLVAVPIVLYNLRGARNSLLETYKNNAINEQKQLLNNDKISQATYNERVGDIKQYYDDAKDLDPKITAQKIQQDEPTFRGDDTDYSVYSGGSSSGSSSESDDSCDCDSDDCCDSDCDSDDCLSACSY